MRLRHGGNKVLLLITFRFPIWSDDANPITVAANDRVSLRSLSFGAGEPSSRCCGKGTNVPDCGLRTASSWTTAIVLRLSKRNQEVVNRSSQC